MEGDEPATLECGSRGRVASRVAAIELATAPRGVASASRDDDESLPGHDGEGDRAGGSPRSPRQSASPVLDTRRWLLEGLKEKVAATSCENATGLHEGLVSVAQPAAAVSHLADGGPEVLECVLDDEVMDWDSDVADSEEAHMDAVFPGIMGVLDQLESRVLLPPDTPPAWLVRAQATTGAAPAPLAAGAEESILDSGHEPEAAEDLAHEARLCQELVTAGKQEETQEETQAAAVAPEEEREADEVEQIVTDEELIFPRRRCPLEETHAEPPSPRRPEASAPTTPAMGAGVPGADRPSADEGCTRTPGKQEESWREHKLQLLEKAPAEEPAFSVKQRRRHRAKERKRSKAAPQPPVAVHAVDDSLCEPSDVGLLQAAELHDTGDTSSEEGWSVPEPPGPAAVAKGGKSAGKGSWRGKGAAGKSKSKSKGGKGDDGTASLAKPSCLRPPAWRSPQPTTQEIVPRLLHACEDLRDVRRAWPSGSRTRAYVSGGIAAITGFVHDYDLAETRGMEKYVADFFQACHEVRVASEDNDSEGVEQAVGTLILAVHPFFE